MQFCRTARKRVHAHACTFVHACARASLAEEGRACIRVHVCTRVRGRVWAMVGLRASVCTRVHACALTCSNACGRASTRVHTRARVCMHAGTVWGGVVVYMGGGGWVRVGVVGCESQAFLKRLARVARRRIRPEGSWTSSCVLQLVLITRATKVSRKDHAMSNKQIIKDRIMERARVHGMGRRARVHGKDLGGRVYEARLARLLATTCLMHVESSFVG
jgi:hypothetical protein